MRLSLQQSRIGNINADMHWSEVMKSTREHCPAEGVSYSESAETDTINGFAFRCKRILHFNDGSNENIEILSNVILFRFF